MKTIKEVELEEKLHRAWETQEQLEYENNKYKIVLDKIKKYIKENIADIEFMEKEYGIDILNTEIEVEYNDIKYLVKLLEEIE